MTVRPLVATIVALLALGFTSSPSVAQPEVGYAWADQPSAARYAPDARYAYNSGGGAIEVTRQGLGDYTVVFRGLGGGPAGGHVQVSSYGPRGVRCEIGQWGNQGGDFVIRIHCFAAISLRADAQFTVLTLRPASARSALGYAWASNPGALAYQPDAAYAYSGSGLPVSIRRLSLGRYAVRFQGLASGLTHGGNAQVTAYGQSGEFCQTVSWHPNGADAVINIACFNAAGAPAGSRFAALFTTPAGLPGPMGFAWGDRPLDAAYAPHRQYRHNPGDGDVGVQRLALGTYAVRFDGFGGEAAAGGTVKASAYGPDPAICQPERWGTGTAETDIVVRCFGPDGFARDSAWSLLALRLQPGAPLAALEPLPSTPAAVEPAAIVTEPAPPLPTLAEPVTTEPAPAPTAGTVTQRRLLPDGSVEIRYPNGTVKRIREGGYTIRQPDGTVTPFLHVDSQPAVPPSLPPATEPWLSWHNQSLLEIIRGLTGNEAAVTRYLTREQNDGLSLYEQIARRTDAIDWMLQE